MATAVFGKLGMIAILAGMTLSAVPAQAGSKPRGAKNADPNAIIKIYAGKTWIWSKGGVYLKADGSAEQVWEDSIGSGKWAVSSKGTMCRTMVFHWIGSGGKEGSEPKKYCNKHVVDKEGVIWQGHDKEKNNWYRLNPDKKIQNGNKIKSKYRKLERKIAKG